VAYKTGGVFTDLGNSRTPHVVGERDVYEHNGSFDGTAGVGVGVVGNRPATCTTGVAYWATDEGEWWADNPGADGRLYKCTATDTWTLYYTPFEYPHPLTGDACDASIDSFSASPDSILLGASSTLTWATTGATTVDIDNGVGTGLDPDDSDMVSPMETTLYTLEAFGTGCSVFGNTTVTVTTSDGIPGPPPVMVRP
jgi:hypothetical protein